MKPLILLHGALGSKEELQPLAKAIEDRFSVHLFEFEGHGQTPLTNPFSVPSFAEKLAVYIKENKLAPADIFGYSMGGYVALYLAATQPELVNRMITLGTKLNWTAETAQKEIKMLNPEVIEEKVPQFANYLARLHGADNWKKLLYRTSELMIELGDKELLKDRFSGIRHKCFLGRGSLDNMVSREETFKAVTTMPNATYFEMEGTPHPLPKVDAGLLGERIALYLAQPESHNSGS